jgi:hypothetical protein
MITLTCDGTYTPEIVIREHTQDFRRYPLSDLRFNLFQVLGKFPEAYAAVKQMLEERVAARKAGHPEPDEDE